MKLSRYDLIQMKLINSEDYKLASEPCGYVGEKFLGFFEDKTHGNTGFDGALFHNDRRFYGVWCFKLGTEFDHRATDSGYVFTHPWVLAVWGGIESGMIAGFLRFKTKKDLLGWTKALNKELTDIEVNQFMWVW